MAVAHRITTEREKWRFVCPRSREHPERHHTNWYPIDGKFRCRECEKERRGDPSIDPDYDQLVDQKTGNCVSRADVELAIERRPPEASSD